MKTMYLALEFNAANFFAVLLKDHSKEDVKQFMKELNYEFDVHLEPEWSEILRTEAIESIVESAPKVEPEHETDNSLLDNETKDSLNSWLNNGGY